MAYKSKKEWAKALEEHGHAEDGMAFIADIERRARAAYTNGTDENGKTADEINDYYSSRLGVRVEPTEIPSSSYVHGDGDDGQSSDYKIPVSSGDAGGGGSSWGGSDPVVIMEPNPLPKTPLPKQPKVSPDNYKGDDPNYDKPNWWEFITSAFNTVGGAFSWFKSKQNIIFGLLGLSIVSRFIKIKID